MSVHYKFKSTRDFDTITFDGLHISVGDLKKAIIHQKRLGKVTDFDLQITNAQTKEEYADDSVLIPKNTSLVIARIPLTNAQKKSTHLYTEAVLPNITTKVDGTSLDLSKMTGTEEEKIQEMIHQSTVDYDPKSYQKVRGQNMNSEVPASYRCNKCKKGGHWIKNCPLNSNKEHMEVAVKRNTGIPKSFRNKEEKAIEVEVEPKVTEKITHIPDDLICSICNDIFVDAVMIPCCGSSFCDDCVRSALLESEDNECPDCKERGSSPGSLIPNRFLRNSVNAFKNESGYKDPGSKKLKNIPEPVKSNSPPPKSPEKEETDELIINKSPDSIETHDPTPEQNKEKEISKEFTKECHDEGESDYDDNITVTMPTNKMESNYVKLVDRKDRSQRSTRTPESSNIKHLQPSYSDSHRDEKHSDSNSYNHAERRTNTPGVESYKYENGSHNKQTSTHKSQGNIIQSYAYSKKPEYSMRSNNMTDRYPGPPHRLNAYHQVPTQPPLMNPVMEQMGPYNNMYNQMGVRSDARYPQYGRPMYPNVNPMCMPIRNDAENMQHSAPLMNLASVYQGVAAKVGPGIIDDPLEAFNRIMKEKEKRKQDNRMMDFRRSRSIEHQHKDHRLSPYDRKGRQPMREKREHSRDQDRRYNRVREKDTRYSRRRSYSYSDRNTRSRSNSSPSYKRRNASPMNKRSSRERAYAEEKFLKGVRNRLPSRDDEYRHNNAKQHFRRSRSRERSYNYQHSKRTSNNRTSQNNTKSDKYVKSGVLRPLHERLSMSPEFKRDNSSHKLADMFQNSSFESNEPPPPGFEPPSPLYNNAKSYANPNLNDRTPELQNDDNLPDYRKQDIHISKKRRHSRSQTPKTNLFRKVDEKEKTDLKDEIDSKKTRKVDDSSEQLKGKEEKVLETNKGHDNVHTIDKKEVSKSHSPNRDIKKENSETNQLTFRDEKTAKYFEKVDAKIEEKVKEKKKKKKEKGLRKKLKKDKKFDVKKKGQRKSVNDSDSQHDNSGSEKDEKSNNERATFSPINNNLQQNKQLEQMNETENKLKQDNISKEKYDQINLDRQIIESAVEKVHNSKEQVERSFSPEISKLDKHISHKASTDFGKTSSSIRSSPKESIKFSNSKSELQNFQITVPKSHDGRSIDIKDEKKIRSYSPTIKKPIMERLGDKVTEDKSGRSATIIRVSYSKDKNYDRMKNENYRDRSTKKDQRNTINDKFKERDNLDKYKERDAIDKNKERDNLRDKERDNLRDKERDNVRDKERDVRYHSNNYSERERLKSSVNEVDKRFNNRKDTDDCKRFYDKYDSRNSNRNEKKEVKYENPFATKNRDYNRDRRDYSTKFDRNNKMQIQLEDLDQTKGSCSGSDSDERRKRKHKTKKDKSRRTSSSESTSSERKKNIKVKKRSKSAKKKKKSKK
ncbi:E3 ubiquitin-protein ligase RBBP6 isoform X2 [Teleopsis dalmanni]|uniref:E3 ubiquitin-protein ligase RBBP6 isoform X2 n=1 Tax=Teleopsis dalmanni TaxID=139649 RepID=UPI0018CD623D|nr:E3 ubiquitin-protein ligase RBBP6 isoform X2 [Teleopsis dalmanni]